ncbi:MAG: hypothetical protein IT406_00955 [Candidatus Yanofskybacteria bacterium]|nr:hypothetical protein [Candidatus Yanofskybacteria bacterium]
MNEQHSPERLTSKDFQLSVERVDVEHGHVYIADGPVVWKWFWDKDAGRAILVTGTGNEQSIAPEKRMAMRDQVRKIMTDRLARAEARAEEH